MQLVHKINDFFYKLFPEVVNADKDAIIVALKKYYTYGPFIPVVTIEDDIIKVDVDTDSILSQDLDYNKSVSLCEIGKFEEAKTILQSLILKNPSNSEFHRILGQIHSEQGNQDEAINALIDALRWDSNNGWALMMMGNIFARHKSDTLTALKYYDQAISVNKADHGTLTNIAYLLFQENKLNEAKKYARESLKIKESYPNALFIMSLISEKENELGQSFNYAIEAVKNSRREDSLYENAVKQAIKIGNENSTRDKYAQCSTSFSSKLEEEGGISISITDDNSIPTAAKIELAEIHNRDYHLVKYNNTYPAFIHLIMHELVHLDFVIQARKENQNHVFQSTQKNKNDFIATVKPFVVKLKALGLDSSTIDKFIEQVFNGLNLQMYNTPIDLFIEDYLYKSDPKLRPFQFTSLLQLLKEAIAAATDEKVLELIPPNVTSATKILSLLNAMQFNELFGINLLLDFRASSSELKKAEHLYKQYSKIKNSRLPGQEFELVKQWGKDLNLDQFFELEKETKFGANNDIDDFITKLQNDPFGLNEPENPLQQSEMEKFKKHQEAIGTNMAIVMFMVDALQYFKSKTEEEIKATAYEIAMLGTMGIDPYKENYIISNITGKRFSGNQVLAYYYVSWALSMPEIVGELGLDFSKEFELARKIAF